ncbi:unnamed protein product, partial [Aphanomyces euteiches]
MDGSQPTSQGSEAAWSRPSGQLQEASEVILNSFHQVNQAVRKITPALAAVKVLENQVLTLAQEKQTLQEEIKASEATNLALKLEAEAVRMIASASKEANVVTQPSRDGSE